MSLIICRFYVDMHDILNDNIVNIADNCIDITFILHSSIIHYRVRHADPNYI